MVTRKTRRRCPYCNRERIIKHWTSQGKQRLRCLHSRCWKTYLERRRYYNNRFKNDVINTAMYLSVRRTAKIYGISQDTVKRWKVERENDML